MTIKHITLLTVAALAISGCASDDQPAGTAAVEIKGTSPTSGGAPAPSPSLPLGGPPASGVPDASGVVTYEGYQAAVARDGDTVGSVADRIGLSASELGAYNGLAPSHVLRGGDELVLPPRPGGYGSQPVASTPTYDSQVYASAGQSIQSAPIDGSAPAAAPGSGAGWSPDLAAAAIDRANAPTGIDDQGNLAQPPSSAQPLPPSPQPPVNLASPQLRQYQTPTGGAPARPAPTASFEPAGEPQVPVAADTLAPVPGIAAAPAPASEPQPVVPTPTPAPTTEVAPTEEQVAVVTEAPASETPAPQPVATGPLRLIPPVSGPIVNRFGQGTGRSSYDGIDFAAPANAPVVAAAAGEVALVSQSLGGLGNIVLIRHQGEYLTVYGRIEKVNVSKGELVAQGQRIGVVSPSPKPSMHFELRRGAEGLDPERYF